MNAITLKMLINLFNLLSRKQKNNIKYGKRLL